MRWWGSWEGCYWVKLHDNKGWQVDMYISYYLKMGAQYEQGIKFENKFNIVTFSDKEENQWK